MRKCECTVDSSQLINGTCIMKDDRCTNSNILFQNTNNKCRQRKCGEELGWLKPYCKINEKYAKSQTSDRVSKSG